MHDGWRERRSTVQLRSCSDNHPRGGTYRVKVRGVWGGGGRALIALLQEICSSND